MTPPGFLPRIAYAQDHTVIAANALARHMLGMPRIRGRMLPDGLAAEAAEAGALPRSTFLTLQCRGGARPAVAHYARDGAGFVVDFEPLEQTFAFTAQILDPVLVTDHRGTLVHVNQAAVDALETPPEHFVGHPALFLGAALGLETRAVESMLRQALTGRGVLDDFVLRNGQGRSRRFAIRSSPWRFGGCVCGAIWVSAETTWSEERDPELVSATWYRMSATYQHELRNPLQTMQAAVDLGRLKDDGRNARQFDILDQSVKMMSDFLADQLQPWMGGPAPLCTLSGIAEEEIARSQIRHSTKGLSFHHRPVPAEPKVRAHRSVMTRVFANLFRNVAQARPDASVTVDYALDGEGLVCRVSDDGPGFPPTMLSANWINDGDLRKHLGLAIVTAAVETYGGVVRLDNPPQGGARITIRLPLADASPTAGGGPAEAAAARETRTRAHLGGRD